jgi:hypothetical protein
MARTLPGAVGHMKDTDQQHQQEQGEILAIEQKFH